GPGQGGAKGPPTRPQASDTNDKKWFTWSWWWLLAIIPVLVLGGLVAVAALRNRRRGRDDDLFDTADDGFGHGLPASYAAAGPLASDDRGTARFEDRYPREALGESAPSGGFTAASVWGAPPEHTDEADT